MDGNGRWAAAPRPAARCRAPRRRTGRPPHDRGGDRRPGVRWLTLYAFSSENWRRPPSEVLDLTGLLRHYVRQELAELKARGRPAARHRRPRAASMPTCRADLARPSARPPATAGSTSTSRCPTARAPRSPPPPARPPRPCSAGTLDPADLDETAFAELPVHLRHARPRPGHPHQRRAPAVATSCCGSPPMPNWCSLDVLWPDFGAAEFDARSPSMRGASGASGRRPG